MNAWTFTSDFPTVKITVLNFPDKKSSKTLTLFTSFQLVIAMVLVQQAWFVIKQVDNVHARQMYPDYNVEFVKMDSKIIQIAQVINGNYYIRNP